jgi:yeast amino acid transporter
MSMKDTALGVATSTPPDHSNELGHDKEEGIGRAPDEKRMTEGTREQDFMTRNGLNLRSFTKRKSFSLDRPRKATDSL